MRAAVALTVALAKFSGPHQFAHRLLPPRRREAQQRPRRGNKVSVQDRTQLTLQTGHPARLPHRPDGHRPQMTGNG